MNRQDQYPPPPPENGRQTGRSGRWSGGWAARGQGSHTFDEGQRYGGERPPYGQTPPNDYGRPEDRFSRNPGDYGENGRWNTPGPNDMPPPKSHLRQTVKRTVKLVLPALLILFLVEYIFSYGIAYIITAYASRVYWSGASFPADTYYGIPYGLYDLLVSYLPVVVGEIAAILYLRSRTGLRLSNFFTKPQVVSRYPDPSGGMGYTGVSREMEPHPLLSGPKLVGWVVFASLAGIGMSMVGQILATLELNFFYEIGFPYYSPDFSTSGYTLLDTTLCNLYVCVVGPVIEELIFRGYMLRTLRRHGTAFAVIVTSVMFMLFHMNLVQLFTPLLTGMFLGLLAVRTGSLIPSIFCHILNNTLSTVVSYLPLESDFAVGLVSLGQMGLFIVIFALFWALWGRQFTPLMRDRDPELKLSQKLGAAFSCWPSVVYILLYIGMILLSTLMTWYNNLYY